MEKYILTENNIENLPVKDRRIIDKYLNDIQEGIINLFDLQELDKTLQDLYYKRVLFNYGSVTDEYFLILATNLKFFLEKIVKQRNYAVEKELWDSDHWRKVVKGLEDLQEFVQKYLNSYGAVYGHKAGTFDLKEVSSMVTKLEKQLNQDLQYFEEYRKNKLKAENNYMLKKSEYDRLSPFGKLKAIIRGQKEELETARNEYIKYHTLSVSTNDEKNTFQDPLPYQKYVEEQEEIRKGKSK